MSTEYVEAVNLTIICPGDIILLLGNFTLNKQVFKYFLQFKTPIKVSYKEVITRGQKIFHFKPYNLLEIVFDQRNTTLVIQFVVFRTVSTNINIVCLIRGS